MKVKQFLKENIKGEDLLELLDVCWTENKDYFDDLLISNNVNKLCKGMTPEQIIDCVYEQDIDIYSDYFQLKDWKLNTLDEDEAIRIAEENADKIIGFYLENREYINNKNKYVEELIEVC